MGFNSGLKGLMETEGSQPRPQKRVIGLFPIQPEPILHSPIFRCI